MITYLHDKATLIQQVIYMHITYMAFPLLDKNLEKAVRIIFFLGEKLDLQYPFNYKVWSKGQGS